jgi:hydrogenase maturation protease
MTSCRAVIVGVGQAFAGDDGAGLAVLELLRGSALPSGVELTEVREPTGLVPLLDEEGMRLVIVDAVLALPAGQVLDLDASEVESRGLSSVSSHGISVGEALALGRATNSSGRPGADVRIVAITIARPVRGALGLSAAVAAAVPRAARLALERVRRTKGD